MVDEKELARLRAIEKAALKVVKCRGRYHTELFMHHLAAEFGLTLPLPKGEPSDGEMYANVSALGLSVEDLNSLNKSLAEVFDSVKNHPPALVHDYGQTA